MLLDIIVLSNEYRKSEYCLNEAGIIWFKSEESEKSVIVLSLSSELIQAGFIDNDYIQLRLMDPNFLGKLSDRLKEMLSKHGLRQSQADFTCFNKLVIELEDYKKGLPFIENLIIPYTSEGSKDIELSKISDAWNRVQQFSYRNPNELKVYPYIFYKEYIRQIRLSASDIPGKIRVKTITKSVIVNLSSKDYADEYSSLFPELDRKRIIDIFDVYFKEELCKSGALSNYYTLTAGAVTLESIKCANEALLKQGEKLSDIQHNVKEINAKVTKALSICRTLLNECGFILIAVAGCLVAGSISQLNVPFFYLYVIISYIFSATFTSSIQKTLNLKISAIKNSEKYIRSNHFLLAEVIAIYTLISVGVYLIIVETQPLLQQSVEQSVEIRLIEIICVFVGGIISQFLKSISQVCFIDAKDM